MVLTSTQKWLAGAGGAAVLIMAVGGIVVSLRGEKGPEAGDRPVPVVQEQFNRVTERETKFKGLHNDYLTVPPLNILPANRMVNTLGIDDPQQMAVIGNIDLAFRPRWQEKMEQCNQPVRQAYVKYREAQSRGDQGAMSAARQELTDAVAGHKRTLDELNNEYRQAVLGVLTPRQAAKYPVKPVDASPMPKL